jgi:hypothetical protein
VPVLGGPGFRAAATPSLRVKLLTWVLTVPGQEEPLANLTVCPAETQPWTPRLPR